MSVSTLPQGPEGQAQEPKAQTGRHGPLPRWQQVRDDLRARIDAGEFPGTFPGELALTDQYDVSRHTVREALGDLRRSGLIVSERGRPSRIARTTVIEQSAGALYSLFESVAAAGLTQRSTVLTLDMRCDAAAAAALELPADSPLVFLERIRLADDEPLAVDKVWLPFSVAAPLLDADFEHTSLYDELRVACGVHLTGGSERIHAMSRTATDQNLLAIDASVALLVLHRTGCSEHTPMEYRETRIRGDRFFITADFAPGAYRFQHSDRPDRPDRSDRPDRPDHSGRAARAESSS